MTRFFVSVGGLKSAFGVISGSPAGCGSFREAQIPAACLPFGFVPEASPAAGNESSREFLPYFCRYKSRRENRM